MPGAKGKKGMKEKKIGNLQDLLKENEKQASNIVQGETSQSKKQEFSQQVQMKLKHFMC